MRGDALEKGHTFFGMCLKESNCNGVPAHLSNNTCERQLAQEKLSGLLKVPDLSKRAHAGAGSAFFYWTPCLKH